MNLLIMIAIAYIVYKMLRSKDIFSPAAIFCFVIAANALIFYLVAYWGLYPTRAEKWWQVKLHYMPVGGYVMLFYLGWCIFCYMISTYLDRTLKVVKVATSYDKSMSIVDYIFLRHMTSPYMFVFLLLIGFLFVCHFSQVDMQRMIHNRGIYLVVRDPLVVGITNPVLKVVHMAQGLFGCLLATLAAFYYRGGQKPFLYVTLCCWFYCLFFTCAFMSRFAPAQLFLFAFVLHITKKRFLSVGAIAVFGVGFIVYAVIMGVRYMVIGNYGNFGMSAFVNLLSTGGFLVGDIFYFFFFNFFGGGFILGGAFLKENFYYPLKYIILSFSPLISALDGFASVEKFSMDLNKIVPTAPMGNFAEAYGFGLPYLAFFCVLMGLIIYVTTKFWKKYPGFFSVIFMSPMYLAFMKMQSFQIRSTIRLCYLTVFITGVLWASCSKVAKRLAQAQVASSVGTELRTELSSG